MISATQLYDFVQCPHRVALDVVGDQSLRDEPNSFLQLLWEQGVDHETNIVASLGISADISQVPLSDRERETLAAMQRGEPLIYGGRLTSGDLIGEPDLLERRGGGYIPNDIKSGSGFEGDDRYVIEQFCEQYFVELNKRIRPMKSLNAKASVSHRVS